MSTKTIEEIKDELRYFNPMRLLDELEQVLKEAPASQKENVAIGLDWVKTFRQRLDADMQLSYCLVAQGDDSDNDLAERFAMSKYLCLRDLASIFQLPLGTVPLELDKQHFLKLIPKMRKEIETMDQPLKPNEQDGSLPDLSLLGNLPKV